MSSTGEVMIMVTDVNDRNPQFNFLSYSVEVYEDRTMVCSSVVELRTKEQGVCMN